MIGRIDADLLALGEDRLHLEDLITESMVEQVTASENIAYQLAFNSMQVAWQQVQSALAPALAGELQDIAGYKRLVRAVARHNPEAARKAAQALVEQGSHSVIELIERMRAMGSP